MRVHSCYLSRIVSKGTVFPCCRSLRASAAIFARVSFEAANLASHRRSSSSISASRSGFSSLFPLRVSFPLPGDAFGTLTSGFFLGCAIVFPFCVSVGVKNGNPLRYHSVTCYRMTYYTAFLPLPASPFHWTATSWWHGVRTNRKANQAASARGESVSKWVMVLRPCDLEA